MSLPLEYFKNKEHIKDLQKLKDDEIYFTTNKKTLTKSKLLI